MLLALPHQTVAQTGDRIFDSKGFEQNRDYFSQLPFEHVDTANGGLTLTFTDVVLPGAPGLEVRFQRVYSSKGGSYGLPGGAFGIANTVMRVEQHAGEPNAGELGHPDMWLPKLLTADGAEHPTIWTSDILDDTNNDPRRYRWVVTRDFWRYDRTTRQLYMPDGRIMSFDTSGRLTRVATPFSTATSNYIEIAYDAPGMRIVQHLDGAQSRELQLTLNDGIATQLQLFAGASVRTWTYVRDGGQLTVNAPEGRPWVLTNSANEMTVRTPGGGQTRYVFAMQQLKREQDYEGMQYRETRVLTERHVSGDGVTAGTWRYIYEPDDVWGLTVMEHPDGETRTLYQNGYIGLTIVRHHIPGQPPEETTPLDDYGLQQRHVQRRNGGGWETIESENRHHLSLPVNNYGSLATVVDAVTTTRDERSYVVTHTFENASNFYQFHHPTRTTESGGGLSRTTTRAYRHDFDYDQYEGGPQILGLLETEGTDVAGDGTHYERSWSHDHRGFATSQTTYGITTTFNPTDSGQIEWERDGHGHETSYTYDWGVVKSITRGAPGLTPTGYLRIDRTINAVGTVASETRRGQTTTFTYDNLFRIRTTQPPGPDAACTLCSQQASTPIVSTYDNTSGRAVTVTRGQSWTRTEFDGFGRVLKTESSDGVKSTKRYDAEGRLTFESLPWGNGRPEIGVTRQYDGLGRPIRETHDDGAFRTFAYGVTAAAGPRVTITDEEGRQTVHEFAAFGSPSEARLQKVIVPTSQQNTWQYSYTGLGQLEVVTAPDGTTREWRYDEHNLLRFERHPESGGTNYEYDGAGRLSWKKDALGTETGYGYDALDRVREVQAGNGITAIDYLENSDLRSATTFGDVRSTFAYDNADRMYKRTDRIRDHDLVTTYGYDTNDRLKVIRYPSGLEITYDIGQTSNQIQAIRDVRSGHEREFATGMTYHPSGALAAVTLADGHVQSFGYDQHRYWPRTIASAKPGQSPTLSLSYTAYDLVGNLKQLADATHGSGPRTFAYDYDALDRLTYASGPAAWNARYDAHGNRTTYPGGTTYAYDAGTLRLTQQGSAGFTYDANGNLKTTTGPGEGRSFDYDLHNHVVRASGPNGAASYEYDADDLRKVRIADGATFFYVHGQNGELLSELIEQGGRPVPNRDYVYAGSRLIASVEPAGRVTIPEFRVSLSTPAVDFEAPASIPLVADVRVGAGQTVARVDFYRGKAKIGSVTSAPYAFTFAPAGAGRYSFTARAVLTTGRVAFSTPLPIRVIRVGRPLGVTFSPNPAIEGQPVTITVDALEPCGALGFDFGWSDQPPGGPDATNDYVVDAVSTLPHVRTYDRWPEGTFVVRVDGHGNCRNSITGAITIQAANPRPVVALTAPANGASFAHGAPITLSATASDPNGTVTAVEFRDGTTVIATDTTAPYSIVWTNAAAGPHTITAVGIDNEGGRGTSPAVAIAVTHLSAVSAAPSPAAATNQDVNVTVTGSAACSAIRIDYGANEPDNVITYPISGLPVTKTRRYVNGGVKTITVTGEGSCVGTVSTTLTINVNTPPTVSLTSPANGATVAGPATINLTATASDSDGVNRVEFLQNGNLIGSDTTAPYSLSWPNVAPGVYSVTARAVDNLNAAATSTAATVTVTHLGTITVSPSPSVAGQPTTVTVNGVSASCSSVEITYAPGVVITHANGTLPTSQPYTWNTAGTYAVSVRGQGACTGTASTTHTVNANTPPTVSLTNPANGANFLVGATVTLSATASDSHGIDRVEFYNGGTFIASDTTSPYSLSFTNAPAGSYSITARAVDAFGAATTSAAAAITVTHLGSVSASPAAVVTGQPASLTVTGSSACGSVQVNYGDGTVITHATGPLPATLPPYTWWAAGTKTVTVTGQGSCVGTTSTTVAVSANTGPTVSLTSPVHGASFQAGGTITLTASASDPQGVNRVEYYNGGALIGSATTAPYTVNWPNVPAGTYYVMAHAVDVYGAWTNSTISTIAVNNGTLSGITFSAAPRQHQPITFTVTGTNPCGAVEINYGDGWVETYPISQLPMARAHTYATGGWKTVIARGMGNCQGQVQTSVPVDWRPTIAITSPVNGSTFVAPAGMTITASASDADGGIHHVDFYANGVYLGTDSAAPWSFTWGNVPAASYTLTAVATDLTGHVADSAGVGIGVNAAGPSQVTGVVAAPDPAGVNQGVAVTVYGTNPCGSLQINWGDGNAPVYPIAQLPYTFYYAWGAPGSKTIIATGMGNCAGQVATTVTITP